MSYEVRKFHARNPDVSFRPPRCFSIQSPDTSMECEAPQSGSHSVSSERPALPLSTIYTVHNDISNAETEDIYERDWAKAPPPYEIMNGIYSRKRYRARSSGAMIDDRVNKRIADASHGESADKGRMSSCERNRKSLIRLLVEDTFSHVEHPSWNFETAPEPNNKEKDKTHNTKNDEENRPVPMNDTGRDQKGTHHVSMKFGCAVEDILHPRATQSERKGESRSRRIERTVKNLGTDCLDILDPRYVLTPGSTSSPSPRDLHEHSSLHCNPLHCSAGIVFANQHNVENDSLRSVIADIFARRKSSKKSNASDVGLPDADESLILSESSDKSSVDISWNDHVDVRIRKGDQGSDSNIEKDLDQHNDANSENVETGGISIDNLAGSDNVDIEDIPGLRRSLSLISDSLISASPEIPSELNLLDTSLGNYSLKDHNEQCCSGEECGDVDEECGEFDGESFGKKIKNCHWSPASRSPPVQPSPLSASPIDLKTPDDLSSPDPAILSSLDLSFDSNKKTNNSNVEVAMSNSNIVENDKNEIETKEDMMKPQFLDMEQKDEDSGPNLDELMGDIDKLDDRSNSSIDELNLSQSSPPFQPSPNRYEPSPNRSAPSPNRSEPSPGLNLNFPPQCNLEFIDLGCSGRDRMGSLDSTGNIASPVNENCNGVALRKNLCFVSLRNPAIDDPIRADNVEQSEATKEESVSAVNEQNVDDMKDENACGVNKKTKDVYKKNKDINEENSVQQLMKYHGFYQESIQEDSIDRERDLELGSFIGDPTLVVEASFHEEPLYKAADTVTTIATMSGSDHFVPTYVDSHIDVSETISHKDQFLEQDEGETLKYQTMKCELQLSRLEDKLFCRAEHRHAQKQCAERQKDDVEQSPLQNNDRANEISLTVEKSLNVLANNGFGFPAEYEMNLSVLRGESLALREESAGCIGRSTAENPEKDEPESEAANSSLVSVDNDKSLIVEASSLLEVVVDAPLTLDDAPEDSDLKCSTTSRSEQTIARWRSQREPDSSASAELCLQVQDSEAGDKEVIIRNSAIADESFEREETQCENVFDDSEQEKETAVIRHQSAEAEKTALEEVHLQTNEVEVERNHEPCAEIIEGEQGEAVQFEDAVVPEKLRRSSVEMVKTEGTLQNETPLEDVCSSATIEVIHKPFISETSVSTPSLQAEPMESMLNAQGMSSDSRKEVTIENGHVESPVAESCTADDTCLQDMHTSKNREVIAQENPESQCGNDVLLESDARRDSVVVNVSILSPCSVGRWEPDSSSLFESPSAIETSQIVGEGDVEQSCFDEKNHDLVEYAVLEDYPTSCSSRDMMNGARRDDHENSSLLSVSRFQEIDTSLFRSLLSDKESAAKVYSHVQTMSTLYCSEISKSPLENINDSSKSCLRMKTPEPLQQPTTCAFVSNPHAKSEQSCFPSLPCEVASEFQTEHGDESFLKKVDESAFEKFEDAERYDDTPIIGLEMERDQEVGCSGSLHLENAEVTKSTSKTYAYTPELRVTEAEIRWDTVDFTKDSPNCLNKAFVATSPVQSEDSPSFFFEAYSPVPNEGSVLFDKSVVYRRSVLDDDNDISTDELQEAVSSNSIVHVTSLIKDFLQTQDDTCNEVVLEDANGAEDNDNEGAKGEDVMPCAEDEDNEGAKGEDVLPCADEMTLMNSAKPSNEERSLENFQPILTSYSQPNPVLIESLPVSEIANKSEVKLEFGEKSETGLDIGNKVLNNSAGSLKINKESARTAEVRNESALPSDIGNNISSESFINGGLRVRSGSVKSLVAETLTRGKSLRSLRHPVSNISINGYLNGGLKVSSSRQIRPKVCTTRVALDWNSSTVVRDPKETRKEQLRLQASIVCGQREADKKWAEELRPRKKDISSDIRKDISVDSRRDISMDGRRSLENTAEFGKSSLCAENLETMDTKSDSPRTKNKTFFDNNTVESTIHPASETGELSSFDVHPKKAQEKWLGSLCTTKKHEDWRLKQRNEAKLSLLRAKETRSVTVVEFQKALSEEKELASSESSNGHKVSPNSMTGIVPDSPVDPRILFGKEILQSTCVKSSPQEEPGSRRKVGRAIQGVRMLEKFSDEKSSGPLMEFKGKLPLSASPPSTTIASSGPPSASPQATSASYRSAIKDEKICGSEAQDILQNIQNICKQSISPTSPTLLAQLDQQMRSFKYENPREQPIFERNASAQMHREETRERFNAENRDRQGEQAACQTKPTSTRQPSHVEGRESSCRNQEATPANLESLPKHDDSIEAQSNKENDKRCKNFRDWSHQRNPISLRKPEHDLLARKDTNRDVSISRKAEVSNRRRPNTRDVSGQRPVPVSGKPEMQRRARDVQVIQEQKRRVASNPGLKPVISTNTAKALLRKSLSLSTKNANSTINATKREEAVRRNSTLTRWQTPSSKQQPLKTGIPQTTKEASKSMPKQCCARERRREYQNYLAGKMNPSLNESETTAGDTTTRVTNIPSTTSASSGSSSVQPRSSNSSCMHTMSSARANLTTLTATYPTGKSAASTKRAAFQARASPTLRRQSPSMTNLRSKNDVAADISVRLGKSFGEKIVNLSSQSADRLSNGSNDEIQPQRSWPQNTAAFRSPMMGGRTVNEKRIRPQSPQVKQYSTRAQSPTAVALPPRRMSPSASSSTVARRMSPSVSNVCVTRKMSPSFISSSVGRKRSPVANKPAGTTLLRNIHSYVGESGSRNPSATRNPSALTRDISQGSLLKRPVATSRGEVLKQEESAVRVNVANQMKASDRYRAFSPIFRPQYSKKLVESQCDSSISTCNPRKMLKSVSKKLLIEMERENATTQHREECSAPSSAPSPNGDQPLFNANGSMQFVPYHAK